jgi:uncharacterized protein
MDKTEAIKIAKKYLENVGNRYRIKSAILFGSFAQGTNHPESDIDLAIVFESIDDVFDMQVNLMQMRSDDDLLIEPHPFRLSDFTIADPLVNEILKKGIELVDFAA